MNKIASYQRALLRIELEKRASTLVERYGTCDGHLPDAYAQAFMEMEKEALLADIGKAVTGGVYRVGKAIAGAGGAGASGSRTGVGGRLMDWASSMGGKAGSGASVARLKAMNEGVPAIEQVGAKTYKDTIRPGTQRLIGGAALGTAGLGVAGGGYMMGG